MRTAPFEWALDVADAVRRTLLRATGPFAKHVLVFRERRVAFVAALVVVTSWAFMSAAPVATLLWAPLILGVPHLLADVRYLWVQPGFHKRVSAWGGVVFGTVAAALGWGLRGALVGAVIAVLFARASVFRRIAVASVLGGIAIVAQRHAWMSDVVFAHAHNWVAVVFFIAWRRRTSWLCGIPLALLAVAVCAAFLGAANTSAMLDTERGAALVSELVPGVDASWAVNVAWFYGFSQGIHYGVWLRLVPEEARTQSTPRSFRQSVRALERDLGSVVLLGSLLLALSFFVWGFLAVMEARHAYLTVASFHGYLELSVGALLLCEGRGLTPQAAQAASLERVARTCVST